MECNGKPPIDETKDAIGRRLETIPFTLQAKDKKYYDLLLRIWKALIFQTKSYFNFS